MGVLVAVVVVIVVVVVTGVKQSQLQVLRLKFEKKNYFQIYTTND